MSSVSGREANCGSFSRAQSTKSRKPTSVRCHWGTPPAAGEDLTMPFPSKACRQTNRSALAWSPASLKK
eukprot:12615607-Alexandrium_andersonii.AAC.1